MTTEPGPPDPRHELAELTAAVRAYVEWQVDTGAELVPVDPSALAALGTGSPPPARAQGHAARPVAMGNPAGVPQTPPIAPRTAAGRPATPTFAAPEWAAKPAPAPAAPAPAPAPPAPPAPAAAAPAPRPAPAPAPVAAPASGAEGDERRTRLALLAEEVRACTRCVLHEKRRQTVFERGNPFADLAFVGEGPGADEDALGAPFVGAAGQLLDRMIAAMGYRRDDVYVANIVKCRPPNNRKPEVEEMASCMPFLVQQLGLVKPKVIVALGATAVQGLCGTTEGITRLRGKWKLYKGSIPIMPTFHPAYLLRNPAAKREVWLDLQAVMKHLGMPLPPSGKG